MTLKELSQLYYLQREIAMDERRLEELEAKLQPGGMNLSEMPHGTSVADKVSLYAAEIVDLRDIIADKQKRCIFEKIRLERYISEISDSLMRQIFTYRFVNGLSWEQVADKIGSTTGGSAKKMCYRYLKSSEK